MTACAVLHSAAQCTVPTALCNCLHTQVKVRRRGSDAKYVAQVLAVGTECDIGTSLLCPAQNPYGYLLLPSCSEIYSEVLAALPICICQWGPFDPALCVAAMLTVEDPAFWEGVEPVKFGVLPRLQDSVTVIGYESANVSS